MTTERKYGRCPRCKVVKDMTLPALSRRNNSTYICSTCGVHEALEDNGMLEPWDKAPYWEDVA